jgi:hypothetical protein
MRVCACEFRYYILYSKNEPINKKRWSSPPTPSRAQVYRRRIWSERGWSGGEEARWIHHCPCRRSPCSIRRSLTTTTFGLFDPLHLAHRRADEREVRYRMGERGAPRRGEAGASCEGEGLRPSPADLLNDSVSVKCTPKHIVPVSSRLRMSPCKMGRLLPLHCHPCTLSSLLPSSTTVLHQRCCRCIVFAGRKQSGISPRERA